MHQDVRITDTESLREQLLSREPMQRALALHALEVQVERRFCGARHSLAHEVTKFTARGIPYFSPSDEHYQQWVCRVVSYWERLQSMPEAAATLAESNKPLASGSHADA